jgi:hypothetical protein
MRKQNPPLTTSQGETNQRRRNFLRHSLIGGIGLSLLSAERIAAGEDLSEALCNTEPAPSDALAQYKRLISEVQSNIHLAVISELRSRTIECNHLFGRLRELVDRLEKAVSRSPARAQVVQMRELTEMARAHANLITKASTSTRERRVLTTSMSYVSQQVGKTAQDLLPTGQNVLSAEASGILNEIVKLVNESIPQQQALITKSQDSTNALVDTLQKKVKSVDSHLEEATSYAVKADYKLTPQPEMIKARALAADRTGKAVLELTELKTTAQQKCGDKCDKAVELIDDLINILSGIEEWIKDPARVLAFNASQSVSGKTTASLRQTSYAHAAVAESVGSVLGRHCKPGSPIQTLSCITYIIAPAKGWKWKEKAMFRSTTREKLISVVERNIVQGYSCSSARQLAEDLVNAGLV